ncbi:polyprenyl synthetase family protein [Paenibacillus chitinolyticus]|uniref:polyprenyl synthetase family protein n=1 Tax=Paenibacillus chitinolyticus TaxID=79263 RepID=UPI0026E4D7CB|nr:polyprenyl synthetase family protein [Paenibacillus chitinolyticus]GKS11821.1 heptaprenyl diphosphate synthase component 2 [Paenibacillus chitinolyticus]
MKILNIYVRKKKDVGAIERELEVSLQTDHALLTETSMHLLKAGGKRIRPVLVLLGGEFGTYDIERLKMIAVPLELFHSASLVHDDVIDDADTRRGQDTVKSKWDNRIAMYTGDFIFAKGLEIAARLEDPRVHMILSKALVEMSIGEMEQIRFFYHTEQTLRDYLLRIKRKTALLIAISCQLGAMVAGADEYVSNRLYSFGYNVGLAFQIRDDILDLCGTEKEIGKPPGSDIKQGNITLPVIFALQEEKLRGPILSEIERIQKADGQTDVSRVLDMIRGSGGIEKSSALADRYIAKAIAALDTLPNIRAKQDLIQVAHFIGNRTH